MKPFQGFAGFTGMSQFSQGNTAPEEPAQEQGTKVFDQILQQMKATQQGKQAAEKSKVDMLWPMGTAIKGKI
jgi:hypothetical protein